MKIAIITFSNAINYGALLQTYALQKSIENMGHDCTIIDYRCDHIEQEYRLINWKNMKRFKPLVYNLLNYPVRKVKRIKFQKFISSRLNMSRNAFKTKESLQEIEDYFDVFIVGSDQVWNYMCTGFDKTFFLDFIKNTRKKTSYAASFGLSSLPVHYKNIYAGFLRSFRAISVREPDGVAIIRELLNLEVPVVLDPTLLLPKEYWYEISSARIVKRPYVLLYMMAPSDSIVDFAIDLANRKNCEVIYIKDNIKKIFDVTYRRCVGLKEYLSLFRYAEYVVTNSFHGTVFSINFNKNFFLELQPEPAVANSRLENMLDVFSLRERQIIKGTNANIDMSINYKIVNEILEIERDKSFDYISNIVSDIYE